MRIFEGQKTARPSGTGVAHAHGQAVPSASGSECGRASTTSKTSVGSSESVSRDERLDSSADKLVSSNSISKESNLLAGNKNNKKTDPLVGDCENEKSASQNETSHGETRRKKSAVSQLIARFESQTEQAVSRVSPLPHVRFSRSVTPERGLSSSQSSVPGFLRQRSITPDQRPASASATLSPHAEESLLKKAVVNSAVVAEVVHEEVDLNDNPLEGKESVEEKVNAPFGGKLEEQEEKVIKEKTKNSKDERINEEITNEEDGKWSNCLSKQ